MRPYCRSSTRAKARTRLVLPRPGTPSSSACPPAMRQVSTPRTTSSWPTMALPTSRRIYLASCAKSSGVMGCVAGSAMRCLVFSGFRAQCDRHDGGFCKTPRRALASSGGAEVLPDEAALVRSDRIAIGRHVAGRGHGHATGGAIQGAPFDPGRPSWSSLADNEAAARAGRSVQGDALAAREARGRPVGRRGVVGGTGALRAGTTSPQTPFGVHRIGSIPIVSWPLPHAGGAAAGRRRSWSGGCAAHGLAMSARTPSARSALGGVATALALPARAAVELRLALDVSAHALSGGHRSDLLALQGLSRCNAVLQVRKRLLLWAGHATGSGVLA